MYRMVRLLSFRANMYDLIRFQIDCQLTFDVAVQNMGPHRGSLRTVKESISERIGAVINDLPSGERKAAQTLIAEYPLIGLKTVAEFAARSNVSSPTILRFVSRLGFGTYSDFQSALQIEVVEQLQSPLARNTKVREDSGPQNTEPFLAALLENIRETFAHNSDADLTRLSALLTDTHFRIHLIGGRFTDPVARYMAAHLRIIRKKVFHLEGQEANWRDQLVDMSKRDVLVVFDIRRYQESLVTFANHAAARGAMVVLFTDQWMSPIARVAKHILTCRTTAPSAWDSSTSMLALVEAVISRVTVDSGKTVAARIAALERLRET
jgi:DNA-binding MurR/RpiR family transcriptional regulator